MNINHAVALVTGGASGLGRGTVEYLHERGAEVAILDLPSSDGQGLADRLGGGAAFFPIDVTNPETVESAVRAVAEHYGRIDICVNCAGGGSGARMIGKDGAPHPLEHFVNVIALNLTGTFDVLRWAATYMAKNEPDESGERGLIVNTASIAAMEGQIGQAAYSAAKGGVVSLTLTLARDYARHGIRVMTIAPGIMDTPALGAVDDQLKAALRDIHVFPNRLGEPEDFGRLVASFAENTLLNGETVRLDAATRLGPR